MNWVVLYSLIKKLTTKVNSLEDLTPFSYKGSVETKADLPVETTKGAMYTVKSENNAEYLWNGSEWISIGEDTTTLRNDVSELKSDKVNINDIVDNLTSSDVNKPLSANQGKVLNDSKINKTDVINNLTSDDVNKPLSAAQGKALKAIIDELNPGQKDIIYGFRRNNTDSNPSTRIEYLKDANAFVPITVNKNDGTFDWGSWFEFVNSNIRPVMLSYDGQVVYELNHEDTSKKLDGTDSDIANPDFAGNAMVEFANFKYVSRSTIGDYDYVYFSNKKINDTYKDYAFIDDNHISKNAFYFGMFHGALDSANRMRSIAEMEICRNKNAATEKSYCQANGLGHDMISWSQVNYIWDLLTLLGKTDNLQATFGQGISTYDYNNGVNPIGWDVGQTMAKGCFFGESSGKNCVRTLWIEDLWGRAWQRCQGIILDNGVYKVKDYGPYPVPTDSSATYSEYLALSTTVPTSNGYVITAECGEHGFLPKTVGGGATTYFCDCFYQNASGVRFALVGVHWNGLGYCGRALNLAILSSATYPSVGSRVSKV